MRKYQQLVLLIFSFVSLILVLVYRHEYNKLHYVLEVFNFFGTPCNLSEIHKSDRYTDHFDWGQYPVWQETEDYYAFSGFMNGSLAQALVVNKMNSKLPKKCYLWFEDENPILGNISSHEISEENGLKSYIYKCGSPHSRTLPYAVSFGPRSKYPSSKKIILTQLNRSTTPIKAALCVLPFMYNKRGLVEFLSFHKLIGFKHFIFYYDDLPYSLVKFLTNLREIVEIDFTFFPWNSPFHSKNLSRIMIEHDCSLRTYKKSESSIVLGLNEFLIPVNSNSIYPLLENNFHSLDYIDVPVQTICIHTNYTFRPIILQNTKLYEDGTMQVRKFHFNFNSTKTEKNVDNLMYMVVHAYQNCEGYSGPFQESNLLNMYSTNFKRSTLMRLLHDGQI